MVACLTRRLYRYRAHRLWIGESVPDGVVGSGAEPHRAVAETGEQGGGEQQDRDPTHQPSSPGAGLEQPACRTEQRPTEPEPFRVSAG